MITLAIDPATITFTVYGSAVPAGSKTPWNPRRKDGSLVLRADGRPVIATMDSTKQHGRNWKNAVASAAREAYQGELLRGPVQVVFEFFRVRPGGHFGKGGLNKKGRDTPFPITKPDLLKVARAIEDSLTGVVWTDDAQIVAEILTKQWGEPARVVVSVRQVGAEVLRAPERGTCDD